MAPDPIKITGLAEFTRGLKRLDNDLPKAVRLANNEAAEVVVLWIKPQIPKRSGAAAGSVKARSTRTSARVSAGSNAVPYYRWLDFGGRVGPNDSVERPFLVDGRWLYPSLDANRDAIQERLEQALVGVAQAAGLAVDR